jgi:hypothetical protein
MRHQPLVLAITLALSSHAFAQPASMSTQQAEALVRDVSAKVEQIRGLKFKTPVAMKIITGAEARAHFGSKIPDDEVEATRHTQDAFIQLGLVPQGTNLLTNYLDMAEKGVLGFYESGSHTFYLLDHVSPQEVRGVMAHELTHALEDQYYDLHAVAKKAEGDSDHAIAITSVVEGAAMAVELAFLSREMGDTRATEELHQNESKRADELKIAPSFLQRRLMLPYLLGFTFLLQGKPWEFYLGGGVHSQDLDAAYANPPFSTRQILHPAQYWNGNGRYRPQHLALKDLASALGPGWSKAAEGSIGELGLAVLTGARDKITLPFALMPAYWTNEAANGVQADLYQHYVKGDAKLTLLLTRWESEDDADQFDKALVNRARFFYRYGVNVVMIAGDVGDRGQPLAIAALQGLKYSE